eukprot:CAMPEP_0201879886 /NCGR_PEP_ID=MMETSP0902-20130614/10654_1 /ASSEMBLY_ACC=CAM_ASM_000551 /TAXON_ID=420261 /ORGANISM="Thalassiosira antarctica, Strain CCMP982" /LENGTH=65 /DNA_ID=CAMNT_0048407827 /DNA_START=14 /DNA_END=208 /DNA_ORIENTATION=+
MAAMRVWIPRTLLLRPDRRYNTLAFRAHRQCGGYKIIDSTGALEISEIPTSKAVIGGGAIGLEME